VTRALFAAMEAGEWCACRRDHNGLCSRRCRTCSRHSRNPLDAATVILVFKVGDNMYFSPHAQINAVNHAFFAAS